MTADRLTTAAGLEADLHERLRQPGPLVTITKAQAAWLLERHSAFDAILQAADDRIADVEARQPDSEALGAIERALTLHGENLCEEADNELEAYLAALPPSDRPADA